MNILDEVKKFVTIKVEIKKEAVAELLHDKVVIPALEKAVEIIPTQIDNAYFETKRVEIKVAVVALAITELEKLDVKIKELLGTSEEV